MKTKYDIDLLDTVEQGGCSAKLPPHLLAEILKDFSFKPSGQLLVGAETHDDAAVWKINEETAIIQTTDFFPPLCSDPYQFGQIAAANALSDVFAMGGKAILALNLVMFPVERIEPSVLKEILKGGADKVHEAGAVIGGGHTIDDFPPKYGLAVTGIVHPNRVITNNHAAHGDKLVLTKPIGTGTIIAGHRMQETKPNDYNAALETMKQLNLNAAQIMQEHNVRCATDITGFGLLGHALEMAQGSGMTITIQASKVPLLNGAYDLIDIGCIPGAAFRNLKYVEEKTAFGRRVDYNLKMLLLDAQTSGGLLISCSPDTVEQLIEDLKRDGYPNTAIIGDVNQRDESFDPFVIVEPV
ncbi:MAG: selenide, water dikinase SelD [bacterium]|nr:selenide, water dikinase SelD [bacterium]